MQTEPGAEVTCWLHGHQEDADPSELCGAFNTVPKLPFRNRRWVRSLSALSVVLLCGQEHCSKKWPSLPPFLLQVGFSVAICCLCHYVPKVARHFTAFGSAGFILLQHVMMHAGCGASGGSRAAAPAALVGSVEVDGGHAHVCVHPAVSLTQGEPVRAVPPAEELPEYVPACRQVLQDQPNELLGGDKWTHIQGSSLFRASSRELWAGWSQGSVFILIQRGNGDAPSSFH